MHFDLLESFTSGVILKKPDGTRLMTFRYKNVSSSHYRDRRIRSC